jgi:hypothetical protein
VSEILKFPDNVLRMSKNNGSPAGFSFSLAEGARILTGAFQDNAFGCGRYNPRGKSSGPALLEPSLKVQRDVAHNLNSTLAAEVHRR